MRRQTVAKAALLDVTFRDGWPESPDHANDPVAAAAASVAPCPVHLAAAAAAAAAARASFGTLLCV